MFIQGDNDMKDKIDYLIKLSLTGLENMYCEQEKLFCHKITEDGIPTGMSERYTAMSLIGLYAAKKNGYTVKFPLQQIEDALFNRLDRMDYGELGLVLWAECMGSKKNIDNIIRAIESNIRKCSDLYSTMLLSWVLVGLSVAYSIKHSMFIMERAKEIYKKLLSFYNEKTKLFYGGTKVKKKDIFVMLQKNKIASFAHQIYPIHSLSVYYEIFNEDKALSIAIECANNICSMQGRYGQWWWMYNVDKGSIAERYPVYSVHQDGMAPMALLKLQQVSGENFEKYVLKGINWVYVGNELGVSMIDDKRHIIWRAIQRKEHGKLRSFGMRLAGHLNTTCSAIFNGRNLQRFFDQITKYEVLYEYRPYHLGWLLYALTDNKVLENT